MPIDQTKKYQTRDGREARVYRTDAGGNYPVHCALLRDDRWLMGIRTADGRYMMSEKSLYDLIEVPQTHVRWVNVYRDSLGQPEWGCPHKTQGNVDRLAQADQRGLFARLRIEFTDGQMDEEPSDA